MKSTLITALAILACTAPLTQASALSFAGGVSPIEKIIEMMSDLQQKIVKEGEAAQKIFAEFNEWCEEEHRNLGFSIKTGKGEVADLKATIEKAASDIAVEDGEIEKLTAAITTDEADLKAATAIRAKEATEFAAEEKELMDTVDVIGRAVG